MSRSCEQMLLDLLPGYACSLSGKRIQLWPEILNDLIDGRATCIQQAQCLGLHIVRQAERKREQLRLGHGYSSCSASTCLAHESNACCLRERSPYKRPAKEAIIANRSSTSSCSGGFSSSACSTVKVTPYPENRACRYERPKRVSRSEKVTTTSAT